MAHNEHPVPEHNYCVNYEILISVYVLCISESIHKDIDILYELTAYYD